MSCPDCFRGTARDDEDPKGRMETVHGRKTYIADPPNGSPKGIIIIVPDAFGIDFINNKVLADHYADKGNFKVYLPDFMDGYSAPATSILDMENVFDTSLTLSTWFWKPYYFTKLLYVMMPWMIQHRFGVSMPKVQSFFSAVRENEGSDLPIGAAGFCWGGKHVFNLAHGIQTANGKPLVDAGFTGHPSNVVIRAEVEKVTKPLSIAIGDADIVLTMKGVRQIEEIFKGLEGLDTEIQVYPGARHGFAVRADMRNKKAAQQAGEAEDQAVSFFQRVFSKVAY